LVAIKTFYFRIVTMNSIGAGTDGNPYIGIGGREFRIDSEKDDFEQNIDRTFLSGEKPAVIPGNLELYGLTAPQWNDPSSPVQLYTENLYKYPVYIRFEPLDDDDDWGLGYVSVRVNPTVEGEREVELVKYEALEDQDQSLWLGKSWGKYCYLHQTNPSVPTALPLGTRGI
jgi:hypothetical protein